MFFMMILSYAITSIIDLKATYHKQDKVKLIVYFTLMTLSCAIGIASGYVKEMPSPAVPIKQFILAIIGE
ncbi:MAG: hypothetical protein K0R80_1038 [Clostridia bacterium]|jgi:hypothetical protein|nr:hypothetical protein [Clostridia bacterium]